MSQAIWEHSLKDSKNTLRVVEGLVDGMAKLPGERIILLDDVFTTGATTSACARVLGAAGAGEVWVWTVARGI